MEGVLPLPSTQERRKGAKMRAITAISVIKSSLTPQQRAEGIKLADEFFQDYYVKLKAKHERQRRQAGAINELETTGLKEGLIPNVTINY